MKKRSNCNNEKMALGISIGFVLGTVIGVGMENMGSGIAIGLALGAGIGVVLSKSTNDDKADPKNNDNN